LFARYDIRLDPLAGVSRLSPVERAQLAIASPDGAHAPLAIERDTPAKPNAGKVLLRGAYHR
jgi:hypothetical protein